GLDRLGVWAGGAGRLRGLGAERRAGGPRALVERRAALVADHLVAQPAPELLGRGRFPGHLVTDRGRLAHNRDLAGGPTQCRARRRPNLDPHHRRRAQPALPKSQSPGCARAWPARTLFCDITPRPLARGRGRGWGSASTTLPPPSAAPNGPS